jgi:predicted phosphodiesterase
MYFIGDVHGKFDKLDSVLSTIPKNEEVVQVGDFGIGFPWSKYPTKKDLPDNFKFIRGNHDNPDHCRQHGSYLGDWGYLDNHNIFYISGAESVDKNWRTIGIDYWDDEELSWEELMKAVDFCKEKKPKIIVAHDCPFSIANEYILRNSQSMVRYPYSRTEQALQTLYEEYQPEYFIYGHWHPNGVWSFIDNKTNFICLGELQKYEIK